MNDGPLKKRVEYKPYEYEYGTYSTSDNSSTSNLIMNGYSNLDAPRRSSFFFIPRGIRMITSQNQKPSVEIFLLVSSARVGYGTLRYLTVLVRARTRYWHGHVPVLSRYSSFPVAGFPLVTPLWIVEDLSFRVVNWWCTLVIRYHSFRIANSTIDCKTTIHLDSSCFSQKGTYVIEYPRPSKIDSLFHLLFPRPG